MRHLVVTAACVFGALCSERSDASEAEEFHRYYSYFHGTWISEVEGSESVVVCEDKGTYNLCSFNGGMANEIWGYDPKSKAWTGYGRGGDSSWKLEMDRPKGAAFTPGMKVNFRGKMWSADGTTLVMKQVLNVINKDNFYLEQRTLQADGEEVEEQPTIKFRRIQ